MNQEPQDAAASSQEVLGYENRGKEAKRRENGDDGRENGCGGIHTRKWEELVATQGTLKGNKEGSNSGGERTEWHDVDCQSSTRHQNRPESLSSCLGCLCASHRDDSIANSLLFTIFFHLYGEFIIEGACIRFACNRSLDIHSCQNYVRFSSSLLFSMGLYHKRMHRYRAKPNTNWSYDVVQEL